MFGILYLMLMTPVPQTKEARGGPRRAPINNLGSAQPCVDRLGQFVRAWCLKNGPSKDNCSRTHDAIRISACKAKYWRRSRKLYYQCNWHIRDIWDKSGVRQRYDACAAYFCAYCREFTKGCHLFGCVAVAPVLFFGTCCVSFSRCMVSGRWDFLRCISETITLCSLWQGRDTNAVAIGAWACWLMGLHCGCPFSCRAVTWVAVCLAQREVRIMKLVFLTGFIYAAPLFGKRGGTSKYFRRASKLSRSTLAGTTEPPQSADPCAAARLCSFIYSIELHNDIAFLDIRFRQQIRRVFDFGTAALCT